MFIVTNYVMHIFTTILKNSIYAQDFYAPAIAGLGEGHQRSLDHLTPHLYSQCAFLGVGGADGVGGGEPQHNSAWIKGEL